MTPEHEGQERNNNPAYALVPSSFPKMRKRNGLLRKIEHPNGYSLT